MIWNNFALNAEFWYSQASYFSLMNVLFMNRGIYGVGVGKVWYSTLAESRDRTPNRLHARQDPVALHHVCCLDK